MGSRVLPGTPLEMRALGRADVSSREGFFVAGRMLRIGNNVAQKTIIPEPITGRPLKKFKKLLDQQ